jgi:hypothetical protein
MSRSEAWTWFKAELGRRLGADEAAELLRELKRRRAVEEEAKQRRMAPARIAYWEEQLAEYRAQGRGTKRLEQSIARARALLNGDEPPS